MNEVSFSFFNLSSVSPPGLPTLATKQSIVHSFFRLLFFLPDYGIQNMISFLALLVYGMVPKSISLNLSKDISVNQTNQSFKLKESENGDKSVL